MQSEKICAVVPAQAGTHNPRAFKGEDACLNGRPVFMGPRLRGDDRWKGFALRRTNWQRRSVRAICTFVLFAVAPARADDVADFYKGKAISLIVSASAGGNYDTLARTVARFLGRHVPGEPAIIVRNMAGAGGITAANHLANAAEKDGSQIGILQNGTAF